MALWVAMEIAESCHGTEGWARITRRSGKSAATSSMSIGDRHAHLLDRLVQRVHGRVVRREPLQAGVELEPAYPVVGDQPPRPAHRLTRRERVHRAERDQHVGVIRGPVGDLLAGQGRMPGGTDTCCGLVGGMPTRPVYAGEIQARHLGVAACAFSERGESVVDEVGELVITQPMPSMPVCFWGDEDGSRYRASYFADFPGVWRQGDFFGVNARGGCFVLGRSDATLNRGGVRIGTAEIYAVLASVPEIEDALVVNLDLPCGGFFMPLFVRLAGGRVLDDRIRGEIRDRLRKEYTPRHVPDKIIQVPDIPATLTGKRPTAARWPTPPPSTRSSTMRDPSATTASADRLPGRTAEAHRRLEAGGVRGRLVLTF